MPPPPSSSSSPSPSGSLAVPAPKAGLKQWRRYRDLTQAQLAAKLGVHQATICEWEHQRAVPRVDLARRLTRILEAPSIEALFPSDENGAAA